MRLNPIRPSDNPLYQSIYCFGGGDTGGGGGSAGDFDDSYNQAMGYTDTLGGVGRSDDDGNARQATAEERASANYQSQVQAAADARGGDLSDARSFAEAQARAQAARQFGATSFPEADTSGGPRSEPAPERVPGKEGTVTVAGAPFVSGGRSSELAYADALARSIGLTPEIEKKEGIFGDTFDIDVTDPAKIQGMQQYGIAAPTSVTQQAGVQQARSPNDIRNAERETITDFDGVTLSKGPGVPKDTFVQDTTPRTKEEREMAEDTRYFNNRDLNKDGTVDTIEDILSMGGYGALGYLSDLERKMNIGPTNADGTAAIPGRDFDYERTESGAIDLNDPNFMGRDYLDYEGGAGGTQQGAYFGPARTEFGGSGTPDTIESLTGGSDTGGEGPAVVAPLTSPKPVECPDGYKYNEATKSCEYVGVAKPVDVGPFDPITQNIQYTGIAGLNPFVLQPSYTAPRTFSPLFNVG